MIRIGVIGYGYWGPNLARNFADSERTELAAVADLNEERLALAARRYSGIETTKHYHDLVKDPKIDGVAIATPVASHYEIVAAALAEGKHVWIEKPFTQTADQARRLVEEAERRALTLLVDHTFIYTAAVRKIRELVAAGELGELYYYDSVRINLGLFQEDVNVLWDLAVHDLSIMDFVMDPKPRSVSATGIGHVEGRPEDIAYLTCFFESDLIAHIHVNWLAPVKIRQTLIGGSRQMIVFDDLEPSEKIKIYDRGITLQDSPASKYELLVGYRTGDMRAPHLSPIEALRTETEHFAECIEEGKAPLTDGHFGLRVVRTLEAADQSLRQNGRPVEIP